MQLKVSLDFGQTKLFVGTIVLELRQIPRHPKNRTQFG
jgi:hypothetical protein